MTLHADVTDRPMSSPATSQRRLYDMTTTTDSSSSVPISAKSSSSTNVRQIRMQLNRKDAEVEVQRTSAVGEEKILAPVDDNKKSLSLRWNVLEESNRKPLRDQMVHLQSGSTLNASTTSADETVNQVSNCTSESRTATKIVVWEDEVDSRSIASVKQNHQTSLEADANKPALVVSPAAADGSNREDAQSSSSEENTRRRPSKALNPSDNAGSERSLVEMNGAATREKENDAVNEQEKRSRMSNWWQKVQDCRYIAGGFINDPQVQMFLIILIVINALFMGVSTFDFATDDANAAKAFDVIDTIFLSIFTVELAIQFFYHGLSLFSDSWLVFDFVIIAMSWSMDSVQVIRAFRAFRAFRLISRLSVLRNLVLALFQVAPSMAAIIALLLLILYIYAVLCTVLFGDLYHQGILDKDYFGSLDKTVYTLFEMITLEWSGVVRDIMRVYSWAWLIFGPFLVMTSFILYSLIIAVICDSVKDTEHHDEEEEKFQQEKEMREKVLRLEERLSSMSQQQQVLLQSLQQALADVQYHQQQQEQLLRHYQEAQLMKQDDLLMKQEEEELMKQDRQLVMKQDEVVDFTCSNVFGVDIWQWSGSLHRSLPPTPPNEPLFFTPVTAAAANDDAANRSSSGSEDVTH